MNGFKFTYINYGPAPARRLDRDNFLAWRMEVSRVLICLGLKGFVDGSIPAPSKSIPSAAAAEGETGVNRSHINWHTQDQLLFGWLIRTITAPVLLQVIHSESSAILWENLHKYYDLSPQSSQVVALQDQFLTSQRGNESCAEYCTRMKAIADELASLGAPVSDEDLAPFSLNYPPTGAPFLPDSTSSRQAPETMNNNNNNNVLVPPVYPYPDLPWRLVDTNFVTWEFEVLSCMNHLGLTGFLDGSQAPPDPSVPSEDGIMMIRNPAHKNWNAQDQILRGWLLSTISAPLVQDLSYLPTTASIWADVQAYFSQQPRGRVVELQRRLLNFQRGTQPCSVYCLKMQTAAGELGALGAPVSDTELVTAIAAKLGPAFEPYSQYNLVIRPQPLPIDDFLEMLLVCEQMLVVGGQQPQPQPPPQAGEHHLPALAAQPVQDPHLQADLDVPDQ